MRLFVLDFMIFYPTTQTRETDTARLEEELGATKAREVQAETRLNAEIRLRSEEMDKVREEHQVLVSRKVAHTYLI
jgi:hypothetical protein